MFDVVNSSNKNKLQIPKHSKKIFWMSYAVCTILLVSSCSAPEPEEEWIVESDFTLAGLSRSDLLLACQEKLKKDLEHPQSFEYVTNSEVFDREPKSKQYRVFFDFYAQGPFADSPYDKSRYDGYCKFDNDGDIHTSLLISLNDEY